jgi:hypothetical protein
MPVSAGGETADTGGRGKSSTLRRRLLVGVAFVVLVGFALVLLIGSIGGATWPQLARYIGFDEPSCSSAGQDPHRVGCIASLPIQDIDVMTTGMVGLSPNGDTLLLGGPLRSDDAKVALAGFNVAERRETWRTALDGLVRGIPIINVAVSANGDKAAVWGVSSGVRVVDLPGGTPAIDVSREALQFPSVLDVSFSKDGDAILIGDAKQRRSFHLAKAALEPSPAPGFELADTCRPHGRVGQSDHASVRSRDGKVVVLLPTISSGTPVRFGQFARTEDLSEAICGTSVVTVLAAPAGWPDVSGLFASFSPKNDRLAVVYGERSPNGVERTLIEIWESGYAMKRLAAFSIRGKVGYRIGWSQDAHRFAAIRSVNYSSADALIYAIP